MLDGTRSGAVVDLLLQSTPASGFRGNEVLGPGLKIRSKTVQFEGAEDEPGGSFSVNRGVEGAECSSLPRPSLPALGNLREQRML